MNKIEEKPDIDDFLHRKLLQAKKLENGYLPTKALREYFDLSNDAQLKDWLKIHSRLPFYITKDDELVLKFTKQDLIDEIKREYFKLRSRYIFKNPPQSEWFE
jgi:hypothetical protein